MKSLLIGLVSVMATVAFANEGAATTAPATAPTEQKVEAPKDAAHGAPAEHKEHKAEKKAKKNKKAKAEKVEKTEKTEEAKH